MSSVIGLDHGGRRIGVAVGDTETGMAFARPPIIRRNLEADLAAIEALVGAEHAEVVVMGLPFNMDGSEGDQARLARAFGDELASIGVRIVFQDERLSSWEAGERLRAEGRSHRRESGELDSTAARLILQQYLEAARPARRPEETE